MHVEEATEADCEHVLPILAGFKNAALGPERWRRLFDYSWRAPTRSRGFLLRDGDQVVGFFGTIWSERMIAGKREVLCNLTSWITLPEYRNSSLLLLKAVVDLPDCTLTCHTLAGRIYPLFKRFGFEDLETKLRILLPLPSWNFSALLHFRATTDRERILAILEGPDRDIFLAHKPYPCGHLLVHGRDGYCYMIFTKTKGRRASFAHLQYISNRDVFLRALDLIKLRLFLATGTPFVMIDARLMRGIEIPHSREVALGRPYVYRSASLRPEQIDNLYSEMILLGI